MFETLQPAPPDAIMGLTDAFKRDPRPEKVNLTMGVYKDHTGTTPIFESVKEAERRILSDETTKSYLSIEGEPEYARAVQELVFGQGHPAVASQRVVTAHTPGGTGALRVAADLLHALSPGATVWLSDPTWPNHPGIFEAAGFRIAPYPYYDAARHALDYEGMLAGLSGAAAGDIVLLHGCCHNPTGIDLSLEQWEGIAEVAHERGVMPFVDFAYQGLGTGLEEDAAGLRLLCERFSELVVASSFSKNFGLYRERTGGLSFMAATPDAAAAALTHIKRAIRVNYSNPPAHGGFIVTTVLGDPALRAQWVGEVDEMRERIRAVRQQFVDTLAAKGCSQDFGFITRQNGMFSFSGLTEAQVARLREEFGIYIVGSGRINVAGINESNIDYLCASIAAVLD